nr:hypothetical protein Iba_chr13eCG12990 [Ipomoea batatas]
MLWYCLPLRAPACMCFRATSRGKVTPPEMAPAAEPINRVAMFPISSCFKICLQKSQSKNLNRRSITYKNWIYAAYLNNQPLSSSVSSAPIALSPPQLQFPLARGIHSPLNWPRVPCTAQTHSIVGDFQKSFADYGISQIPSPSPTYLQSIHQGDSLHLGDTTETQFQNSETTHLPSLQNLLIFSYPYP